MKLFDALDVVRYTNRQGECEALLRRQIPYAQLNDMGRYIKDIEDFLEVINEKNK